MGEALDILREPAVLVPLTGVLGLLVGSFLNVVIHRLPRMEERAWRAQCLELLGLDAGSGEPGRVPDASRTPVPDDEASVNGVPDPEAEPYSLVRPRSHCPACGHLVGALENIPLLSWIVLRGRCRHCGAPISARYPLVEALSGILSAVLAWKLGVGLPLVGGLLFTWALVALAFIDLDTQLLPDAITLPWLWLGLLFNLGGNLAPLGDAVIGAMAGYLCLWLIYKAFLHLTGREGMGYGDFKLLAMIGAWLGWQALPATVLLSSLVGAAVGVTLVAIGAHRREIPIPFGPYLAAAGWIALVFGPELNAWYLGLLEPGAR